MNKIKEGIALSGAFAAVTTLTLATPAPEIIVTTISTALESWGTTIFAAAGTLGYGYIGAIIADYHRMETKGILATAFGAALLGGTLAGYIGNEIETSLELNTYNDKTEQLFKVPTNQYAQQDFSVITAPTNKPLTA